MAKIVSNLTSRSAVDRRVYFDGTLNCKKKKPDSSVKSRSRPGGRWPLFTRLPGRPVGEAIAPANSHSPTSLPNFHKEKKKEKKKEKPSKRRCTSIPNRTRISEGTNPGLSSPAVREHERSFNSACVQQTQTPPPSSQRRETRKKLLTYYWLRKLKFRDCRNDFVPPGEPDRSPPPKKRQANRTPTSSSKTHCTPPRGPKNGCIVIIVVTVAASPSCVLRNCSTV